MKLLLGFTLILFSLKGSAQELFTWSEPASNMAAKSIGVRLNNMLMKENETGKYNYHLLPEIMWGVSSKIMVHAEGFLSNVNKGFIAEGFALYMKYRFYSIDEVHSHFRLAAYSRLVFNNSAIHQPAIDFNGHSSGYEAGLVATKLINKIAVSAGSGFLHANNNTTNNKFSYGNNNRNAIGYNLSFGKLMLPKNYVNYNQTNLNLMLELLGQVNLGTGKSYADLAPTVQFILFSQFRIDAGYRFAVVKDLNRSATDGFLLRLEYNFFNVYK